MFIQQKLLLGRSGREGYSREREQRPGEEGVNYERPGCIQVVAECIQVVAECTWSSSDMEMLVVHSLTFACIHSCNEHW